jgi:serine/threonine-protein kinase
MEGPYGVSHAVAAKVFDPVATDERDLAFHVIRRSTTRSALVRHPNVAQVFDLGVECGQTVRTGELVEGVTLAALMEKLRAAGVRVSLDLAVFIALEVAEGLAAARRAPDQDGYALHMVHGDLSMREVLLSVAGEVKVTDFELAEARQLSTDVRSLRTVAQRCASMSPEVACGERATAESDVFAVGILLHEMLVGLRFSARVDGREALRLARDGILEMTGMRRFPDELSGIMVRAMAVDPRDRYADAGQMAFELRRLSLGLGVGDERVFLRELLAKDIDDITAPRTQPDPRSAPPAPRAAASELRLSRRDGLRPVDDGGDAGEGPDTDRPPRFAGEELLEEDLEEEEEPW